MKTYFNHHCVLKLNLSILMPIILIPNYQLISSKHTCWSIGYMSWLRDFSRSSLCSFGAKHSSRDLLMGLETHPQIIVLLSSSSSSFFFPKVSLLLFDVSAQASFREFLRMFIVILSFAVPVGIHLTFLFRCLGMITGYKHHPFINTSIPVPSWKEKVWSKYMVE